MIQSLVRTAVLALTLFALPSAGRAAEGSMTLVIFKAGWVVGGSAGSGVVSFKGQMRGVSVGGLDYGLVFGGSQTTLQGKVRNIRRIEDVEGVYGAAGAGMTLGKGVRGLILTNQNGAILELSGEQLGLMANFDLSGFAIAFKK